MKSKLIKSLLTVLGLSLSSCDYVENSVSFEELHAPPNVPMILDRYKNDPSSITTILKFQEDLKDYMDYLDNYYVSIGRYYHADTELPQSKKRHDECYISKELFTDFKLPEVKPIDENLPIEVITNELLDYQLKVKKEVKEYNQYMGVLKDRYKDCF